VQKVKTVEYTGKSALLITKKNFQSLYWYIGAMNSSQAPKDVTNCLVAHEVVQWLVFSFPTYKLKPGNGRSFPIS